MIDWQTWSLLLGAAAGGAWLASAVCSFFSLQVKLDISAPPGYGDNVGTKDDGKPAFTLNGMSPPTKAAYFDYQRQVSFWNFWAASLNGLAALLACGAALAAFVVMPTN